MDRFFCSVARPNTPPSSAMPDPKTSSTQARELAASYAALAEHLVLQFEAPKKNCNPINVLLVCDVSGSMGNPVNPNGTEGSNLFSRADLQQLMAEVAKVPLGPDDRFGLVTFTDLVKVVLPLTNMTPKGQQNASSVIRKMVPSNNTELLDAIAQAFKLVNDETTPTLIVLLTDGQPSTRFGQPEIVNLLNKLPTPNRATIATVGIGYGHDIDSKLLADVANTVGNGSTFLYVPDGTMLLTNIVNLVTWFRTLYATNTMCVVRNGKAQRLTPVGFSSIYDVSDIRLVGLKGVDLVNDLVVDLGPIPMEQRQSLVFTLPKDANLDEIAFTLDYRRDNETHIHVAPRDDGAAHVDDVFWAKSLATMNGVLQIASINSDGAKKRILDLIMSIPEGDEGLEGYAIAKDVCDDGEVVKALEPASWAKWGGHFLRALLSAHKGRRNGDFKNPGLQGYGGTAFRAEQARINELAKTLPPLLPSIKSDTVDQSMFTSAYITNTFNNASNGCFAPGSRVLMANGGRKAIQDLAKDDLVWTPTGQASVMCVVAYLGDVETMKMPMGPWVTPYHPTQDASGAWHFPCRLVTPPFLVQKNDIVYTLVLSLGHTINIEDHMFCTLGHGMTGPVIEHDFYGRTVVDDLNRFPGWAFGLITLREANVVRRDNEVIAYRISSKSEYVMPPFEPLSIVVK